MAWSVEEESRVRRIEARLAQIADAVQHIVDAAVKSEAEQRDPSPLDRASQLLDDLPAP